MEPPILFCLSCGRYANHQDSTNGLTRNKEFNNPDQVLLNGCKTDPNHINPILPPTPKPFNSVVVKTPMMWGYNCMKMSGYEVIGSSDLFLLDSHQESLNVDFNPTMTWTIVGTTRKFFCCWTTSWDNNFALKITKSLCTEEMKYDSKVAEWL